MSAAALPGQEASDWEGSFVAVACRAGLAPIWGAPVVNMALVAMVALSERVDLAIWHTRVLAHARARSAAEDLGQGGPP